MKKKGCIDGRLKNDLWSDRKIEVKWTRNGLGSVESTSTFNIHEIRDYLGILWFDHLYCIIQPNCSTRPAHFIIPPICLSLSHLGLRARPVWIHLIKFDDLDGLMHCVSNTHLVWFHARSRFVLPLFVPYVIICQCVHCSIHFRFVFVSWKYLNYWKMNKQFKSVIELFKFHFHSYMRRERIVYIVTCTP